MRRRLRTSSLGSIEFTIQLYPIKQKLTTKVSFLRFGLSLFLPGGIADFMKLCIDFQKEVGDQERENDTGKSQVRGQQS